MAIIIKSYNITHIKDLTIEVSDVKKPFDDLYDELNGFLDSSNFSSGFSIGSSQVIISASDLFISATTVNDWLKEAPIRGYNDIHFFAHGQDPKILTIFPGRMEVNGTVTKVKQRFDLSMTNSISHFLTGSFTIGTVYAVLMPQEEAITNQGSQSFKIVSVDNISASLGINLDKNGYYHSESYRCVYTFYYDVNSRVSDWEFIDPPRIGQRYNLSAQEVSEVNYFNNFSYNPTTSACARYCQVTRIFDMNEWRYYYEAFGTLNSSSFTSTLFTHVLSNEDWLLDSFKIERDFVRELTEVDNLIVTSISGSEWLGSIIQIDRDWNINSNDSAGFRNIYLSDFYLRIKRNPLWLRVTE